MRWTILLFFSLSVRAQEIPVILDKFCGINTFLPSTKIDSCEAQDAENVLTDGGRLEKFPGAEALLPEVLNGHPVKSLWAYTSSDGSKYVLAHASQSIYASDFSGSPVAIGTVSAGSAPDMTQAFGNAYITDGSAAPWYWDGISSAVAPGMPFCKHAEFADERVYCANSSVSTSRLHVSSAGGASYWTVPSNVASIGDAPNIFDFRKDDGEPINCLKVTPWGKVVGKTNSMHILKGYDNLTYYKMVISPNIGCVDDRTMQIVDGSLVWLSREGVYSWSGAGAPVLISKKIEAEVKAIGQITAQRDSWAVTSASDWRQGTIGTTGGKPTWSTTISPGAIVPSTWGVVSTSSSDWATWTIVDPSTANTSGSVVLSSTVFKDNFSDGDYTSSPAWTVDAGQLAVVAGRLAATVDGGDNRASSTINIASGSWKFTHRYRDDSAGNTCYGAVENNCLQFRWANAAGGDYYAVGITVLLANTVAIRILKNVAGVTTILTQASTSPYTHQTDYPYEVQRSTDGRIMVWLNGVMLSSTTDTAISSSTKVSVALGGDTISVDILIFNYVDDIHGFHYKSPGQITSPIFDTGLSSPIGGVLSSTWTGVPGEAFVDFWYRSSTSPLNDLWTIWNASSDTLRIGATQQYVQFRSNITTMLSTKTPTIDAFSAAAVSSGVYSSPVHFVGSDITSWVSGHFDEISARSGIVTYQVRSSATYSFGAGDANPTWQTLSNHTAPSIATGAYVQYRAISNPGSSTDTISINSSLFEWQEGEAPPSASLFHDHRYWLCVVTGGTENNVCYVLQKNNEWTKFTTKSLASLAIHDGRPVAGDGSTDSRVWRIMDQNEINFAGSAIDAFWLTKDFTADNQDSILNQLWLEAEPASGADVDVAYMLNKSTVSIVTKSISLDRSYPWLNLKVPMSAGFARARYHRFRIRNDDLNEQFKIHRLTGYFQVMPRTE